MPSELLSPVTIGNIELHNRFVMAPLTRRRASADHVPQPLMIEYYRQRASAGLIISEATAISPQGIGYNNVPGIYSREQLEAWKPIPDAVHKAGGKIYMQLWHVGRISHSLLQPGKQLPVSASAISAGEIINTPEGHKPMETPRALETEEIAGVVNNYRQSAVHAMEAGFDGVEIHGANGYLIDQFLHSSSNHRDDKYGGSITDRARFLFEIVEAVTEAVGNNTTGLRLSPSNYRNGMDDPDSPALYSYVIEKLNSFNLSYLHLIEPLLTLDKHPHLIKNVTKFFRPIWKGPLISAGNYTLKTGEDVLKQEIADMVAFGRLFIANPDLPKRFAKDAPLNEPDTTTFYAGGEKGYIDYPKIRKG